MAETLQVHLYGEHMADVIDAGQGQCALKYTDRARAVGPPARLSLSLPIRDTTYPSARGAMRWLRSLLPEGPALQAAVEEYGIAADDVFGLLAALGRDVAGAVVFVPEGEPLEDPRADYQPLDDGELADRVRRSHTRPLGLDRERGVRLSLAGVQDKLLLHKPKRSSRYYQPVHGKPSTIIVKPEPRERGDIRYRGLATNEALCLNLARTVGLDPAEAHVETFGEEVALVVRRFDRKYHTGGDVTRVHQEDMLSAMGMDPFLKYERHNYREVSRPGAFEVLGPARQDPGPGLDQLADLIEQHLGRVGVLRLIGIVAFNTMIGNADAHARNLSFLLHPDGDVRFSPLYDLLCTRAYPGLTRDAPQQVNGVVIIDEITVSDMVAHASRWGLPDVLVRDRVTAIIASASEQLDEVIATTVDDGGEEKYAERVGAIIRDRAGRLLEAEAGP